MNVFLTIDGRNYLLEITQVPDDRRFNFKKDFLQRNGYLTIHPFPIGSNIGYMAKAWRVQGGLYGGEGATASESSTGGMNCCCIKYHPREASLVPFDDYADSWDSCGLCGYCLQTCGWIPAIIMCPCLCFFKLVCGDCCVRDRVFTN